MIAFEKLTVLVCGGRDYSDRRSLYTALDAVHASNPIAMLITGGASGADTLAWDWASSRRINRQIFNADWQKHGGAAGPIRNQLMLDRGKPDMVIAFPGGVGTADMVRRAEAAGISVTKITRGANLEIVQS